MQLKVVGGVIVGAAVVAVGAVIAQADTQKRAVDVPGGLAVENGLIERQAAAGAANTVKIRNNSKAALNVAVTPRPWTQSASGVVSANRRSTLSDVGVSESAFALKPGETRDVVVTLKTGTPQYGALEIVGLPEDIAQRKGLVAGYRLVSALRYKPAIASYALKAGAVKVKAGVLTLSVKSSGNTAEAVSGSVRLKGPLGTRQSSIKAVRMLPGKTLALELVSTKSLPAGSYTATVALKQGTFKANVTKKINVKR